MTNLTEQWKKGKLPEGKYWVKYEHWTDTVEMLDYCVGMFLDIDVPIDNDRIEQILAPVPSYEEWKDLKSKLQLKETAYDFDTARLAEENAQLKERVSKLEKMKYSYTPEEWNTMLRTVNRTKELLKECKEIFDECFSPSAKHGELYKKIDEVLR